MRTFPSLISHALSIVTYYTCFFAYNPTYNSADTSNLSNQEKVWLAEQKAAAEAQKVKELQTQIQLEREKEEFEKLAGKKSKGDRGVNWMYEEGGGPAYGENAELEAAKEEEEKEAYLLGKEYVPQGQEKHVGDFAEAATMGGVLEKASTRGATIGAGAVAADVRNDEAHVRLKDDNEEQMKDDDGRSEFNKEFHLRHEDPMFAVHKKREMQRKEVEKKRNLMERAGLVVKEVRKGDQKDEKQREYDGDVHKRAKKDRPKKRKKHHKHRHHRDRSSSVSSDSSSSYSRERRHRKKRDKKRHRHHSRRNRRERSSSHDRSRSRDRSIDRSDSRQREKYQSKRDKSTERHCHDERKQEPNRVRERHHTDDRHGHHHRDRKRERSRSRQRSEERYRDNKKENNAHHHEGRSYKEDDLDEFGRKRHTSDKRERDQGYRQKDRDDNIGRHSDVKGERERDYGHRSRPSSSNNEEGTKHDAPPKKEGYGLIGTSLSGQQRNSNSSNPDAKKPASLGPDADVLAAKRREMEQERQAKLDQSRRRWDRDGRSREDKERALEEFERNARSRR